MPDFDVNTPHIARIYDYLLGGKDNFEADRKATELALAASPTIVPGVRANRRFLAQRVAPEARVVYVDNDPIAATASGGRSSDG